MTEAVWTEQELWVDERSDKRRDQKDALNAHDHLGSDNSRRHPPPARSGPWLGGHINHDDCDRDVPAESVPTALSDKTHSAG